MIRLEGGHSCPQPAFQPASSPSTATHVTANVGQIGNLPATELPMVTA